MPAVRGESQLPSVRERVWNKHKEDENPVSYTNASHPSIPSQHQQAPILTFSNSQASDSISSSPEQGENQTMPWHPRVIVHLEDVIWEDGDFAKFMNELRYPKWMVEDEITLYLQKLLHTSREKEGIDDFREWCQSLHPDQLQDTNSDELKESLSALTMHWRSFISKVGPDGNEATHRLGVNNLIELAFQLCPGADHLYSLDQDLVTPGQPELVRACAIATQTLPSGWRKEIDRVQFTEQYIFSWGWKPQVTKTPPSVISFAFEAKVDDFEMAEQQVIQDMYCAQMHRRALCLADGPVFGTALANTILYIYVSFWDGDKLEVRQVKGGLFRLTLFGDFVDAYFFLSRIADYQSQWLANELTRWDLDKETQLKKLNDSKLHSWRNKYQESESGDGNDDDQTADEEVESVYYPDRVEDWISEVESFSTGLSDPNTILCNRDVQERSRHLARAGDVIPEFMKED